MSLSQHVRTLGRGPGRSRALTQDEAGDAMRLMLDGQAAPEAVGALLMLLRMKGETAEEIAGFAAAAQGAMPALPPVDLDWPSYAAGRTRGAPWFLVAAKLVSQAGYRVLLHGWNGADQSVREGLCAMGIPVAETAQDAARFLDHCAIAYLPLETSHPALFRLMDLRDVLGLRSCINTVCRMLNPAQARASVQGVFHPSYRLLQADAAALLGWDSLSAIKGGGGEFECNPSKDTLVLGLRRGAQYERHFPPRLDETRKLSATNAQALSEAWSCRHLPAFETEIILGTAALALDTLGAHDAMQTATTLWSQRNAPHRLKGKAP